MTRRGGAGKGSVSEGCRGTEHGQACTKVRTGAVAHRTALELAVQLWRRNKGNRQAAMSNPTNCRDSLQMVFNFLATAVATVGVPTTRILHPEWSRRVNGGLGIERLELKMTCYLQVSDADMFVPGSSKEFHVARVLPFGAQPSPFKTNTTTCEPNMKVSFKNIFFVLNGFVCACWEIEELRRS
jgi:hypothetical protein